jgi:hypothetical protein
VVKKNCVMKRCSRDALKDSALCNECRRREKLRRCTPVQLQDTDYFKMCIEYFVKATDEYRHSKVCGTR